MLKLESKPEIRIYSDVYRSRASAEVVLLRYYSSNLPGIFVWQPGEVQWQRKSFARRENVISSLYVSVIQIAPCKLCARLTSNPEVDHSLKHELPRLSYLICVCSKVNVWLKADFHSVQNVARLFFSERFLLRRISIQCKMSRDRLLASAFFWITNSQAERISLAVVDFTHFKRKRSLKIDRAIFCTEWKSAF